TVTNSLVAKRGVLLLFDKNTNEVWMESVYGADVGAHDKRRMKVQVGTTIATVIETKKPIIVPRMIMAGFQDVKAEASLFEPPLICAPLIYHDAIKGVLLVSGREEGTNFEEEEMQLLMSLATQTAIALENSKLTDDIENAYFETIAALALAVDAKDKYSRGHLERVAHYSVQIGKKIGLDDSEIKILRDAAKLHDLGKIGIPDTVLLKEKALTDDEWVLMRKHPEIGEGIIRPIKSLEHLCDIIRHHHEKLDGSGYPDGLIGDAISPLVRITTIADIYDALTTNRPYRNKHTQHEAIAIMKKMEGQLDVEILDVFIEALDLE
ncbi:MAG: HD-GYP domain-containing protein (c-di-GMP phosphodiesterase class II), partial [Candidatus Omnitrophota bacterium]